MKFPIAKTIKNNLLSFYTRQLSKVKKKYKKQENGLSSGVGLLYTLDSNNPQKTEAIVRAVKIIESSGESVEILCYLPDKIIQPLNEFMYFHTKDVNYLGKFNQQQVKKFLETNFYYFYHIDLVSEPILDYIVAKCKAKYKIGNFTNNRSYIFDILFKDLIRSSDKVNFDNLINKMLEYTQLLKV